MQRASQDQLGGMVGTEYQLLFVQPNILFVVRKQHRASPTHVTPIADYYIINGHIYQVHWIDSQDKCQAWSFSNFVF